MLDSQKSLSSLPFAKAKADFDDGAYDTRWSENRRLKIRGSLNKAAKVLNVLAEHRNLFDYEPVCDVDELDYLASSFLGKRRAPDGCGFKKFSSFYDWWSNCRSFFGIASGQRAMHVELASQSDDWSELIAHATGQRGGPVVFNKYEMIAVSSLARESRLRGVTISDLTRNSALNIIQSVSSTTGSAIVRGIRLLNNVRGNNRIPAEYLPPEKIEDLPNIVAVDVRRVPPIHADFLLLMEDHVERARKGHVEVSFGTQTRFITKEGVSEARAKNMRVALRWYWHGLTVVERADASSALDISRITDPVALFEVVEACAEGNLGPICDPSTRRAMVLMVMSFLESIEPGYSQAIDRGFFESVPLKTPKGRKTDDEINKERECLRFIHDPAYQRSFFTMPTIFFEMSVDMIARFDDLFHINSVGQKGISKSQHRALDLAIMAALTAIMTRFSPRLATLNLLRAKGSQPHVILPAKSNESPVVQLNITADITKNKRDAFRLPLSASDTVDPFAILHWYLETVRPLVIKYKPTDRSCLKPAHLFCGLHKETLRRIWNNCVREINLPITPHMCRHLNASLLYHNGVRPADIAQLLLISESMVMKRYAFIDRQSAIQTAIDAQASIFRQIGV